MSSFLKKLILILYSFQIFKSHNNAEENYPVYIDDSSCQFSMNKYNETLIKCDAQFQTNKSRLPQIIAVTAGTRVPINLLEIKNKNIPILADFIFNTTTAGVDVLSLSLISDGIEEISGRAFANLYYLTTLNLCCNKLKNLNSEIFDSPLANTLNYLDLSQNEIDSIEISLFSNLLQLAYLDLSYNQLTTIESNSFPLKLITIHLDNNYLTSIDAYSFNNNGLLQNITLQNNKLLDIGSNSFVNSQITELDLSYQNLKLIAYNAISHCEMLTKIDLRDNQLTRFIRGSLNDLKSIDSLILANNLIETLVYDNFGNLEKLRYIYLSNNFISSIEDGTFLNLRALKLLSLHNNLIRHLNMNTFRNLADLKTLRISNNKLSIISASIFNHLIHLETLIITANYITTIEPGSFQRLTSLLYLSIDENKLTTVEASMFRGLLKLLGLDLSSNKIETIEANVFNSLANLQSLYLNNNLIKSLDSKVFNGIVALKSLYIEENRLTSINSGTFMNMTSLTELRLGMNKLSYIDNLTFMGLETVLERLNISNNNIFEAKIGALSGLVSLKRLLLIEIGMNPLQLINLEGCKGLTELDMSFNHIEIDNSTFISHNFNNLLLQKTSLNNLKFLWLNQMTNLFELDLSDNEWDWSIFDQQSQMFKNYIPVEYIYLSNTSLNNIDYLGIIRLTSLYWLDLSFNRIEFIQSETFLWPNRESPLKFLFLKSNLIKKIDTSSFYYIQDLIALDLSGNMLARQSGLDNNNMAYFTSLLRLDIIDSNLLSFPIFNMFNTKYHLKFLILASNKIESLSWFHFKQLQNLISLDLANNCIRLIETDTNANGLFVGLTKLETLNLSSNLIEDASLAKLQFGDCFNLKTLNLSRNSIRTVSRFLFSGLKKLEEIDLSYNNLVSIEANAFYLLSALKNVYLLGGLMMMPKVSVNFTYACGSIKFVYLSSVDLIVANLDSFTDSLKAVEAHRVVNGAVYYNSINIIVTTFDFYEKATRHACELTIYLLMHKIHLNLFSDFDFDVFIDFCYSLDLSVEE